MIKLIDVYSDPESHRVLYGLLGQRKDHEKISHKEMPAWEQHCAFVDNRPYAHWYLIVSESNLHKYPRRKYLGAIYLTHPLNEIGIWLLDEMKKPGLAIDAVGLLIERHPRPRYVANINPNNIDHIALFESIGFTHIQNTYELGSEKK